MSMFRRKDEETAAEGSDFENKPTGDTTASATPNAPRPGQAPMGAPAAMNPAPTPQGQAATATTPSPTPIAAAPMPRPAAPSPAPSAFRPATAMAPTAGGPMPRPADSKPINTPTSMNQAGNKLGKRILTVGNDILLKGEIATCDRLVIEGSVDATLKDVHTVEIAQSGSFKGTAEIEDAEISGIFEGDLIVRNRLTIYSTGKVRGTIAYGEIEIERGGQLTGDISIGSAAKPAQATKAA